jgi:hypothetical protein
VRLDSLARATDESSGGFDAGDLVPHGRIGHHERAGRLGATSRRRSAPRTRRPTAGCSTSSRRRTRWPRTRPIILTPRRPSCGKPRPRRAPSASVSIAPPSPPWSRSWSTPYQPASTCPSAPRRCDVPRLAHRPRGRKPGDGHGVERRVMRCPGAGANAEQSKPASPWHTRTAEAERWRVARATTRARHHHTAKGELPMRRPNEKHDDVAAAIVAGSRS